MKSYINNLTLTDLLDRMVSLIGKNIKQYALLAVIFVIPMAIFFEIMISLYLDMIEHIIYMAYMEEQSRGLSNTQDYLQVLIQQIVSGTIPLFFLLLIVIVMGIFLSISSIKLASDRMYYKDVNLKVLLLAGASKKFWRILGFSILIGGLIFLLFAIPYLFILLGIIVNWVFVVLGILLGMGAIVLGIYFTISFSFSSMFIVLNDQPVITSMKASFRLVRGYFWRTFGILLLFGIMLSFGISLITTPISIFSMIGFFQEYIKLIVEIGRYGSDINDANAYQTIQSLFSSIGIGLGIATAVGTVIQACIANSYLSMMYYDLLCKKELIPPYPPEEPTNENEDAEYADENANESGKESTQPTQNESSDPETNTSTSNEIHSSDTDTNSDDPDNGTSRN